MARAKYQVLVIPYKKSGNDIFYCIFKRSDMDAGNLLQVVEKMRTKLLLYLHKGKPLRRQVYLPVCTLQNWIPNAVLPQSVSRMPAQFGERVALLSPSIVSLLR